MIDVNSALLESENVDELIYSLAKNESEDFLMRLGNLRKLVSMLRRILDPKQNIVSTIVSREVELISKDIQRNLRDVLDHISTSIEKLEFSRDSLNHTHANYLTKLSFELSEKSRATHSFMNIITVAATILVPFQIVGSIFGVNVKVPGADDDNLVWFFGIILCLLIFTAFSLVTSYRILLRKK
jgi:magnesium transporter